MNHDDFIYGYELGKSEPQSRTRMYYNTGSASGKFIGRGIASLIGGLLELTVQLVIVSMKGILCLTIGIFHLISKAIPKST